ncbi:hypothetical protein INT43_004735 [Umbelopsis isabellina]|uniref:Chromo domain-containing protein n=1 Tax=Mortierella isabellina TaxID=91625 RepID=A0A8H7U772_MORIS|nr:hypothetical protein INT43_004735 [Umbelopsis isabellina]
MSQNGDSISSDDESHIPEHILEFKWKRKGRFYRVKWLNADEDSYTWEDAEDVEPMYPMLVSQFWERLDTRWPGKVQADDMGYFAQDSEGYNSSQDEDFEAQSASEEDDDDEESEDRSVDWRTVRSIEGMDKTLDGKIRVYVRW